MKFCLVVILLVPNSGWSVSKSILLGHNLTPTTATTSRGVLDIGSYAVTYGVTDQTMVGLNTWLVWGYNSYNAIVRTRWDLKGWWDEVAIQGSYIKSGTFADNFYRMEVGLAWLTWRKVLSPEYTFYASLNFMNFWDETIPFSFRREPGNNDSYQYSASTLHELNFSVHWGMLLELGVLGLNYARPELHSGYSFHYLSNNYLVQFGISVTAAPYNVERLFDHHDQQMAEQPKYDESAHPEIQLQYFF